MGAGLSGLVLAKELSKEKYDITVFERLSVPGGRMITEKINGWELDKGFQVALTGYPYLQKQVDFHANNYLELDSGATIFMDRKVFQVGDPSRNIRFLFPTLFSKVGSLKDKWLIYKLQRKVTRLSNEAIFELPNNSTYAYLEEFGFSAQIIDRFFKPFYSGIFLEDKLETSSRMFLFVFKMFAEGKAVIPRGGIGEIAKGIERQLEGVTINYNTEVKGMQKNEVLLNDEALPFDFICNTNPDFNLSFDEGWKSCSVYYFEHEGTPIINGPRIGLVASKNKVINNLFYADYTQTNLASKKRLLSVTVVNDQGLSREALHDRVLKETQDLVGKKIEMVHCYALPKSLPDIGEPTNDIAFDLKSSVIHLGDHVLNGSQNAACKSAEVLAKKLNELNF